MTQFCQNQMTKLTIKPNEKPTAQVVKGKTKRKTKESGDSCCSAFIQFAIAVAIIFGCTATYLYRSKVLPVYSTKERGVDKFSIGDISSVLCQQYEVNVGRNADIFLVDGEAKISSDKREVLVNLI
ncbi:hypothetical protein LOTGIDRAFT_232967 [Lottia gigantea]|uniref:Uncharacterized protein n=1 Tax=Lottia gigantea TaxID=225164 RepID=V4ACT6_LOTGI|nr:hypothetical protein LOTGIDRAFT_232967 [Lottia gigantea]ESO92895.1 hypothetical protein LOTGIDRAFT_232967 [Lottia gigantea]